MISTAQQVQPLPGVPGSPSNAARPLLQSSLKVARFAGSGLVVTVTTCSLVAQASLAIGGSILIGTSFTGRVVAQTVRSQTVPPQTVQLQTVPPVLVGQGLPVRQPSYPVCQPPNPGEYLLLIVSQTPENQERVRRTLPPSATATVCNYLDDVVTRVSGFTTVDTANAWARYMTESIGLTAFVARPAETPPAPVLPLPSSQLPQPQPSPQPQTPPAQTPAPQATAPRFPSLAFNPQPLGAGYAVLVDYFSQPDLAVQVRQLAGREIGLASYGQRPYLLAIYTADPAIANATLQALTDRGFWAMVVDSRRVTLLRQTIDVSRLTRN